MNWTAIFAGTSQPFTLRPIGGSVRVCRQFIGLLGRRSRYFFRPLINSKCEHGMHKLHAKLWIRIHIATRIALLERSRTLFAFDLCLKAYHGLDVQLVHIITDTHRLWSRWHTFWFAPADCQNTLSSDPCRGFGRLLLFTFLIPSIICWASPRGEVHFFRF